MLEIRLMGAELQSLERKVQKPSAANAGLLQRKCSRCREKDKILQRSAVGSAPETVPPIVHEVLRSPGQPLDAETRAFMEPRFGHDFSNVRVHTDAKAVESARAVNALAYTVGRNVIFGPGQYAPRTNYGLGLLAHELAHAIQQSSETYYLPNIARLSDQGELEADNAQKAISNKNLLFPGQTHKYPGTLQRKQPENMQSRTESANVQGTSWVNLEAPDGHIASLYFATNEAKLGAKDKEILLKIYNTYAKYLQLRKVTLLFIGYADYRGTESYNLSLGRRRAEVVSEYFSPLATSLNYSWGVASAGESEVPQRGTTSKELSPYRRVDIKVQKKGSVTNFL